LTKQLHIFPSTPDTMDNSSSSSDYSESSLIKLSQKFFDRREQHIPHTTVPLSSSILIQQQFRHSTVPSSPSTSSNSSYGYESLLEVVAACPSKPSLVTQGSLRGKPPSVSESFPAEDPVGGWNRTLQGVTTPEDVSLSDEGDTGGQPTAKPPFPVKRFSARDLRERRSKSFCAEESEDVYEPPHRASVDRLSVPLSPEHPPMPLSTYGDFLC